MAIWLPMESEYIIIVLQMSTPLSMTTTLGYSGVGYSLSIIMTLGVTFTTT